MKHHIILLTIVLCFIFTDVFQAVAEEGASDRYLNQFEEIVNIVEKHFYNPEQIIRGFPEIKARYQNEVAVVSSLQGFSLLVNRMLGELDASHTYFLTPDDYEYYQLGALFSKIPEIGSLFKGQEVRYPTVGILTQTIKNKVYMSPTAFLL